MICGTAEDVHNLSKFNYFVQTIVKANNKPSVASEAFEGNKYSLL